MNEIKALTDAKAIIIALSALALGVIAVIIFVNIKETNKMANFIAMSLLCAAALIITWLKFYSKIKS